MAANREGEVQAQSLGRDIVASRRLIAIRDSQMVAASPLWKPLIVSKTSWVRLRAST